MKATLTFDKYTATVNDQGDWALTPANETLLTQLEALSSLPAAGLGNVLNHYPHPCQRYASVVATAIADIWEPIVVEYQDVDPPTEEKLY